MVPCRGCAGWCFSRRHRIFRSFFFEEKGTTMTMRCRKLLCRNTPSLVLSNRLRGFFGTFQSSNFIIMKRHQSNEISTSDDNNSNDDTSPLHRQSLQDRVISLTDWWKQGGSKPQPLMDLRSLEEYKQQRLSYHSPSDSRVVHFPMEFLKERSFELPARQVEFSILLPSSDLGKAQEFLLGPKPKCSHLLDCDRNPSPARSVRTRTLRRSDESASSSTTSTRAPMASRLVVVPLPCSRSAR